MLVVIGKGEVFVSCDGLETGCLGALTGAGGCAAVLPLLAPGGGGALLRPLRLLYGDCCCC